MIEELGEDNFVQVVIDNTPNYKVSGQMFMAKRKIYFQHLVLHIMLS